MEVQGQKVNETRDPGITPGAALRAEGRILLAIVLFGLFVSLLGFTGPLFALQIYDRVLTSRSLETLLALSALMVFLLLIMGSLDHLRKRLAARLAERLTSRLLPLLARPGADGAAMHGDILALRRFVQSPLFITLLDLPWLPLFALGLALFHPLLALLALAAAAALIALPALGLLLGPPSAPRQAPGLALQGALGADPDTAASLAPRSALIAAWACQDEAARARELAAGDGRALPAGLAQTLRPMAQSGMIALAGWLVLRDEISAGAIIAASVLLARILSPADILGQNLEALRSVAHAWRRLRGQGGAGQEHPERSMRPSDGHLQIEQLTLFPPGARQAALRMVSLQALPGELIALGGPAGAGKSMLLRACAGILAPAGGRILLGGVPLDWMDAPTRRAAIGYLPQAPALPGGTIADNITGFGMEGDPVALARAVSLHELIQALPEGYETALGSSRLPLPGALAQGIAIARALAGAPRLLLLDLPETGLDAARLEALVATLKARLKEGVSVVAVTRNPQILALASRTMMLDGGFLRDIVPAGASGRAPAPALRGIS